MLNITDLLGCRFTNHGRSNEDGYDCYGLAIEVSRRLGRSLDDVYYQEASSETFDLNASDMIQKMSDRLEETDMQEQGNLIVFFDALGRMVHIGVIIEDGRFIHADFGGVRVEELDDYYRKDWRIYKWRQ